MAEKSGFVVLKKYVIHWNFSPMNEQLYFKWNVNSKLVKKTSQLLLGQPATQKKQKTTEKDKFKKRKNKKIKNALSMVPHDSFIFIFFLIGTYDSSNK